MVVIHANGGATITGVTYNGAALTKLGGITSSLGSKHEIWYKLIPSTGSNTVSIAYTGSDEIRAAALSFYNVNSVTGFVSDDLVNQSTYNGVVSSSTLSSGGAAVDGLRTVNQSVSSFGSVTNDYSNNTRYVSHKLAASATITMDYTFSGSNTTVIWVGGAVNPFIDTLDAAQGSYTLTGQASTFQKALSLIIAVGSYIYTGLAVFFNRGGWTNDSEPTTSYSNDTKPTTSYSNDTEPTSSYTNDTKP